MSKSFIAVSTVASLVLGVGGVVAVPATAGTAPNSVQQQVTEQNPGRAELKEDLSPIADYSDQEILQLLLAAQGPIAEDHPELPRLLGFDEEKPHTDTEGLAVIIDEYLKFEPDFDELVSQPLQSGDPDEVDRALMAFTGSFMEFMEVSAEELGDGWEEQASGAGWTWQGANVAIYANALGVANVVGYTNAGVATFALAAVAVVKLYLDDSGPQGAGFEREHFVNEFATAFGS
ncbi:hypothetical protein [Nocardiopsis xinjiangensis]|uniref:hypothetical protein n=1 Tax=Nocardiopsis xinjiangensis TaxID=124285 RepID=UPI0003680A44|nr:hypothetical protein [Nocardiopsis xinjiangensis]